MIIRGLIAIVLVLGLTVASTHATVKIDQIGSLELGPNDFPTVFPLYCQDDRGLFYQSRVALLRAPNDSKHDYGISVAHGLVSEAGIPNKTCKIQNHKGELVDVIDRFIPENYKAGTSTDWAVFKLPRLSKKRITRYALPRFSSEQVSEFRTQANLISFPLARGLFTQSQSCLSLPGDYIGFADKNVLTHDCLSIPGQSGSPIASRWEGQDILIGIHLGKGFTPYSPITHKPESYGYFMLLDNQTVDDIHRGVLALR